MILCLACAGWAPPGHAQPAAPLFEEATVAAGLPANLRASTVSLVDFNQDGAPDLFLTDIYSADSLHEAAYAYLNDGHGRFSPLTVTGLEGQPSRTQARFARGVLKAGELTMLATHQNYDWAPQLPLNLFHVALEGKTLKFVEEPGVAPTRTDAMGDAKWIDFDQDGRLDIVVGGFYAIHNYNAVYQQEDFRAESLRLYHNQLDADGRVTFRDVTEVVGLYGDQTAPANTRDANVPVQALSVCDVDGDGRSDIVVSAYGRRWNKLYVQDPSGRFVNRAFELGFAGDANGLDDYRGNGNSFAASCADADNDGRIDLFQGEITHAWAGDGSDLSAFLWNEGAGQPFTRDSDTRRPNFDNQADMGSAWGDFDLDGRQDLLLSDSDYHVAGAPPLESALTLLQQTAPRHFENVSAALGTLIYNPKGATFADIDGDGDLDVVLGGSPARGWEQPFVHVLLNRTVESKPDSRWAAVRLHGQGNVPEFPLGAKVRLVSVDAQGATTLLGLRELNEGAGMEQQLPETLNFGLGATAADPAGTEYRFDIEWPNGKHQSVPVRMNASIDVTAP
jgi:hypothetical protein